MENRWWNSRKIEWYERASRFCDFQSLLTKEIESFITKDESIVEFGCGLGYISENLYNHGYDVTAYDIDQEVIERAKKRSGLDIYHTADYKESNVKRDVVLTVFFGRLWLHDNLSSLLSHGRKRLVSIHSLHIGQNDSLKARYTPTLEESISLLEEQGRKARGREISISFWMRSLPLSTRNCKRGYSVSKSSSLMISGVSLGRFISWIWNSLKLQTTIHRGFILWGR